MKKQSILPLLLVLLLGMLLSACTQPEILNPMLQPVTFYYRTAETDFSVPDGVIRAEIRDMKQASFTDEGLIRFYFENPPLSSDLVSPISPDLSLGGVSRRGSTLELWLIRSAPSPAEFNDSLSYACLVKTGLALEGISKVRIIVRRPSGAKLEDKEYTENDIVLYDNGEIPENMEITLYYSDADYALLRPEKRVIPLLSQEALPEYLLQLLLEAPENSGMCSPLPVGTVIQGVSLENGLCRVYLNDDFYANLPADEQAQQLAVLSVVNTLCELEGVNQVQIHAAGWDQDANARLDLSGSWIPDLGPVGPVREELGEFSGTLCLPGLRDNRLHRLVIRGRARGGESREEALLRTLFSRTAQNGLAAPLSGLPEPLSVSTAGRLCRVELAPGTLPEAPEQREQLLRVLTATLCSLPDIASVEFRQEDALLTDPPMSPAPDWFALP